MESSAPPAPEQGPRHSRQVTVLGLLIVAAAIVTVAVFLSQRPVQGPLVRSSAIIPPADVTPATANPHDRSEAAGYVGSQRCAECHGEIAKSFRQHPMANSAKLIADVPPSPQQLAAAHRVPGKTRVLDVAWKDGGLEHHERMFDETSAEIYDQTVKMLFEVGSGSRAKAYVHQRGDAFFMSPLNWYSEAGKWDLAPNYKPDDDRRFDRRVTDECLSCHTGRLSPIGRGSNRFEKPFFHELSIGCENCHGPGEQHVTFRESGAAGVDPIVNPAKLDAHRRESVCNQCHKQTAVRLLRPGRSHFDFRPGQNLEEVWTLLDTTVGVSDEGKTRSVNHVQQMEQSRCFVASDGRLGCISCHDPHSVPTAAEATQHYRTRCLNCHESNGCRQTPEQRAAHQDSCIACHMPTRDSRNISHVTQTDHRILRLPQQSAEVAGDGRLQELRLLETPVVDLGEAERERALALGAWIYLQKADQQPPRSLVRPLLSAAERDAGDGPVQLALGNLATQFQQLEPALEHFQRGLSIPAAEEESLWGLIGLKYAAGEWEEVLALTERVLKLDPGAARFHAVRADALRQTGKLDAGIQAALTALAYNPTLIAVREWLVAAYREQGNSDAQREQEAILQRMRKPRIPE